MNVNLALFLGLAGIMAMFVAIIVAQEVWQRYKSNKMMRLIDPHWGKYDPDEETRWREVGRGWPTQNLQIARQADAPDERGRLWTYYTFVPIHPNSPSLRHYYEPSTELVQALEDRYLHHRMLERVNKHAARHDYWCYYLGEA